MIGFALWVFFGKSHAHELFHLNVFEKQIIKETIFLGILRYTLDYL